MHHDVDERARFYLVLGWYHLWMAALWSLDSHDQFERSGSHKKDRGRAGAKIVSIAWRILDPLKYFAMWLGVVFILVTLWLTSTPKERRKCDGR